MKIDDGPRQARPRWAWRQARYCFPGDGRRWAMFGRGCWRRAEGGVAGNTGPATFFRSTFSVKTEIEPCGKCGPGGRRCGPATPSPGCVRRARAPP